MAGYNIRYFYVNAKGNGCFVKAEDTRVKAETVFAPLCDHAGRYERYICNLRMRKEVVTVNRFVTAVLCICCMLIQTGCESAEENITREIDFAWVEARLQTISDENGTLVFYPNPMYEYSVSVNEDLIDLLQMETYKEIPPSEDVTSMMIYTDISDENGKKACRTAWFSDGRVLITLYEKATLSDTTKWYQCDEEQLAI